MGYSCCAPARGHYVVRRLPTVAEKVARLEAYAAELENELAGVRERIAWLTEEEDE